MYITYFEFFSKVKAMINDIRIDMSCADLSGEEFDKRYRHYIDKLVTICKDYAEANIVFRSKSAFISDYISQIRGTTAYPQRDRFGILEDITSNFIKNSV